MSGDYYDTQVEDEIRRVHLTQANRARSAQLDLAQAGHGRSAGRLALDCGMLLLLFLMVPAWFHSLESFVTVSAMAAALLLGAYAKVVWRLMEYLGPSDQPRVVTVIQAPAEFHCPCCGERQGESRYCTKCGMDLDQAWRKLVRKLASYAVEETDGCRKSLEQAVRTRLEELAREHAMATQAKVAELEQAYIEEIVRQRQLINALERRLVAKKEDEGLMRRPILPNRFSNVLGG